jgi:hypothetical protein
MTLETMMRSVTEAVMVQHAKFCAELPALMAGPYAGRWVAYLDGVRSAHDDERMAYVWGLQHLGPLAGFCVAQVAPEKPVLLHDALKLLSRIEEVPVSNPCQTDVPHPAPEYHRCNGCGDRCVDDATCAALHGEPDVRSSWLFRAGGGYSDLFPQDCTEWTWRLCEFCLADAVSRFAVPPVVTDQWSVHRSEEVPSEQTSLPLLARDPEALRKALAAYHASASDPDSWVRKRVAGLAAHRARRTSDGTLTVEDAARIAHSAVGQIVARLFAGLPADVRREVLAQFTAKPAGEG